MSQISQIGLIGMFGSAMIAKRELVGCWNLVCAASCSDAQLVYPGTKGKTHPFDSPSINDAPDRTQPCSSYMRCDPKAGSIMICLRP